MPQLKLTEKAILKMPAPDPSGKQVLHWDTELKGFAVLCSGVSNARTYVVQRTLPGSGKSRRLTVGGVNELTLAAARDRAVDMLDNLRRGIDPKVKMITPTLRWALEDYLAARKDLRPASIRLYRYVEQKLSAWLDLPLHEITGDMVEARHRAIAAEIGGDATRYTGTGTANATMTTFRILWNHAADRFPDLPQNPVRRLRRQWYAEPRRTRIVQADDMKRFYDAVQALPNPVARDWFTLMLFTGMRKTEAASLRWTDIDFAQQVIRVPAAVTKGKRNLDLPMSDLVHDLLVARRAIGDTKFAFPANASAGHVSDTNSPIRLIEATCGIRISAHDLRRTFVTVAEACDVSGIALKALINHASTDVTSGYVILNIDRLREPVQRIADRLKTLCGLTPVEGGKVAELRHRRA